MDLSVSLLSLQVLRLCCYAVAELEEVSYLGAVAERVAVFIIELGHHVGAFIGEQFRKLLLNQSLKVSDPRSTCQAMSPLKSYHQ